MAPVRMSLLELYIRLSRRQLTVNSEFWTVNHITETRTIGYFGDLRHVLIDRSKVKLGYLYSLNE